MVSACFQARRVSCHNASSFGVMLLNRRLKNTDGAIPAAFIFRNRKGFVMNILKRSAWSILTLIMLLLIGSPAYATPATPHHLPQQPQETRRPLPPRQYVPSHDYDTKHIALNLHFDWEKEQAVGTAAITLSPLVKDLRAVELDAANMTINSVKLSAGK